MPDHKEMQSKATAAVAAAIALHVKNAAVLMAAHTASAAGGLKNDAEIIARLNLILAKLERPPLKQKERAREHPVSWVKLDKYVELTGDMNLPADYAWVEGA